jgi:hypothetical protein
VCNPLNLLMVIAHPDAKRLLQNEKFQCVCAMEDLLDIAPLISPSTCFFVGSTNHYSNATIAHSNTDDYPPSSLLILRIVRREFVLPPTGTILSSNTKAMSYQTKYSRLTDTSSTFNKHHGPIIQPGSLPNTRKSRGHFWHLSSTPLYLSI